ncbi:hypothetical protein MTO96_034465 [Rhipicephalus appendiculatus]
MVENGRCVQAECFGRRRTASGRTPSALPVDASAYRVTESSRETAIESTSAAAVWVARQCSIANAMVEPCASAVPDTFTALLADTRLAHPSSATMASLVPYRGRAAWTTHCVCHEGNESVSCREGSAAMLSFSEEEPPARETVLLLCGGAIAFMAVGALPVLVWRHLGPGRKLRRPPATATGSVGPVSLGLAAARRADRLCAGSAGARRQGTQETIPV